MSDAVKVQIESGTGRRKIIIAHCCNYWPPELRDLPPAKREVTDNEIHWLLTTLTKEEINYVSRKYSSTFMTVCNEALKRISAAKDKAKK